MYEMILRYLKEEHSTTTDWYFFHYVADYYEQKKRQTEYAEEYKKCAAEFVENRLLQYL